MQIPDSMARIDAVKRTSFRQAYSLTNLTTQISSNNIKRTSVREAESLVNILEGIKLLCS